MFPNPVSREAQISYTLNRPGHIKLQLISLQGGVIQSLADEYQPAGKQTVTFNRQGLAAGLYVIQLSDSQTITRDKILIVND
ncbi:MAG: T9SS type A sorting domain-containing protein [Bacteroidales bacterium]|nr:T9SS type A sorting domain-containing protein [Bacteroidales bacterium]